MSLDLTQILVLLSSFANDDTFHAIGYVLIGGFVRSTLSAFGLSQQLCVAGGLLSVCGCND